ncbi:choline/ethanolaminephosphotransferase 1 bbc isoform X2 [Arctopsyche grandis]|uniref:choline/ethanolaminephosphotransferase 1 bbc isoform X2 n=1 Tax=Arctopsyche grandis TaxID=121162 RepID=UPI00406D6CC8
MRLYRQRLLSSGQLRRLADHRYSCSSASFLDAALQPWWCWLVARLPLWLAPNLITCLGLAVNVFTTLLLVWYTPDAKSEAPRWTYALCGLGLFIYQSLDAIDGKQARRTGTSSPLGELFDHGCDSISTVFVALSACAAVQLGQYPTWMFFQCFCAMTLFYCAHWQTYVSGTLKFGKVDVTEAQFAIIAIQMVSAIFGSNIWLTSLTKSIELRYLLGLMTVICSSYSLFSIFSVILRGGVGKNGSTVAIPVLQIPMTYSVCLVFFTGYLQVFIGFCQSFREGGIGKNGSTVAGTSVLSPVIPFSMVIVPAFIIYQKSESLVYENHPCLYIIAFGMVAAKVTNRLVVSHMTKSEMEYFDWSLMGPAMLFLNQYFNNAIPEYYVLWMCLIWVAVDLIRYSCQICLEICEYLKIKLFHIPYPPPMIKNNTSQTNVSTTVIEKNVKIVDTDSSQDEDMTPLIHSSK